MFHPVSTGASPFFIGGINALPLSNNPAQSKSYPAMEHGEDFRPDAQWVSQPDCVVPQFYGENTQFLTSTPTSLPTPTADDVFSFPSTSTDSSPHISHLMMSDRQSTFNGDQIDFPDNDDNSVHHKTTMRRSQNRKAQRRFRERKEQQKTELLERLEELQISQGQMANHLETMRRSNQTLEADKKRVEREVEMLRKWRQKVIGVMSDIVQQDTTADDLLVKVATSCSDACWRRGIDYSRTFVKMQTLLELFDEIHISSGGRYNTQGGRNSG
ncbi:hypothetical protein BDV06DRAFT_229187 [Aspergillus oleicola]